MSPVFEAAGQSLKSILSPMINVFLSDLDSLGQFVGSNFPLAEEIRHVVVAIPLDVITYKLASLLQSCFFSIRKLFLFDF